MLFVEYKGLSAAWSEEEDSWTSSDPDFEKLLDSMIPEELYSVSAPFREGGKPAIALAAAKAVLGADLKVIRQSPYEPPPEQEGVYD